MTAAGRVIVASGFHAPERGRIEAFRDALIAVDADGTITDFDRSGRSPPGDAERLAGDLVLLPGFLDLHIHAPQYPQLGTALDVPLEDWLFRHTFPLEARYADLDFADRVYRRLVADLLSAGTTTAVYYGTQHVEATARLADICIAFGQRALVGKVALDHPDGTPDWYRDASPEESVAGTRALIDHIRSHPDNDAERVQPIITPRFIPACTDAALEGLGRLAAETGCRVQTHCSESDWEHGHVLARHGRSDTESLARFGLLTPHAVLAHGNHLGPSDMDLIAGHRATVAHCPLSNAYFAGAVFPLKAALDRGVAVGLGSDISGGPAGTIFETARMAVAASRLLESGTDPALAPAERSARAGARVDWRTAFFLATAGGGSALGLPVGRFAPGLRFDAMLIDTAAETGGIRRFDDSFDDILLERILYGANRANIARVWVDGRAVAGTMHGAGG